MKNLYLVIGIVVILGLICSPALAISKSELIAQYKTGYFPGPTCSTPTPIPTTIPTAGPTTIPTGTQTEPFVINPGAGTLFITSAPYGGANVYLDGEWKGRTPPRFATFGSYHSFVDGETVHVPCALVLTDLPLGPHQLTFTQEWFKDYSVSVTLKRGVIEYVTAYLVQISPNPTPTPTVIPTTVPTPAPSNWPYPIVPDSYIKTKSSYLDSLSELFL